MYIIKLIRLIFLVMHNYHLNDLDKIKIADWMVKSLEKFQHQKKTYGFLYKFKNLLFPYDPITCKELTPEIQSILNSEFKFFCDNYEVLDKVFVQEGKIDLR